MGSSLRSEKQADLVLNCLTAPEKPTIGTPRGEGRRSISGDVRISLVKNGLQVPKVAGRAVRSMQQYHKLHFLFSNVVLCCSRIIPVESRLFDFFFCRVLPFLNVGFKKRVLL